MQKLELTCSQLQDVDTNLGSLTFCLMWDIPQWSFNLKILIFVVLYNDFIDSFICFEHHHNTYNARILKGRLIMALDEIRFNTICNITQEPQERQRYNRACRFIDKSAVIKCHQLLSKVTSINRRSLFDQLTTGTCYPYP